MFHGRTCALTFNDGLHTSIHEVLTVPRNLLRTAQSCCDPLSIPASIPTIPYNRASVWITVWNATRAFVDVTSCHLTCKKLGCRASTNLLATATDGLRPTNASKCRSSGSGGLSLRVPNGIGASSSLFSCFVWSLLTSAFVASRTLQRRDQHPVSLGSELNSRPSWLSVFACSLISAWLSSTCFHAILCHCPLCVCVSCSATSKWKRGCAPTSRCPTIVSTALRDSSTHLAVVRNQWRRTEAGHVRDLERLAAGRGVGRHITQGQEKCS